MRIDACWTLLTPFMVVMYVLGAVTAGFAYWFWGERKSRSDRKQLNEARELNMSFVSSFVDELARALADNPWYQSGRLRLLHEKKEGIITFHVFEVVREYEEEVTTTKGWFHGAMCLLVSCIDWLLKPTPWAVDFPRYQSVAPRFETRYEIETLFKFTYDAASGYANEEYLGRRSKPALRSTYFSGRQEDLRGLLVKPPESVLEQEGVENNALPSVQAAE